MTCHKLGLDAEPGLMTVVAPSSHRRVLVVMSSSCRRHVVVMPSVYRRRAVGTSSSCCRAIAVRPSAHCRRAVVSIVIWTRRDLSYPTSACLLNYAKLSIVTTVCHWCTISSTVCHLYSFLGDVFWRLLWKWASGVQCQWMWVQEVLVHRVIVHILGISGHWSYPTDATLFRTSFVRSMATPLDIRLGLTKPQALPDGWIWDASEWTTHFRLRAIAHAHTENTRL